MRPCTHITSCNPMWMHNNQSVGMFGLQGKPTCQLTQGHRQRQICGNLYSESCLRFYSYFVAMNKSTVWQKEKGLFFYLLCLAGNSFAEMWLWCRWFYSQTWCIWGLGEGDWGSGGPAGKSFSKKQRCAIFTHLKNPLQRKLFCWCFQHILVTLFFLMIEDMFKKNKE